MVAVRMCVLLVVFVAGTMVVGDEHHHQQQLKHQQHQQQGKDEVTHKEVKELQQEKDSKQQRKSDEQHEKDEKPGEEDEQIEGEDKASEAGSEQPVQKNEEQHQHKQHQQQHQMQKHRRPNVVVLVADDLGIGDLGCYGNTTINTPNIDRLAREGVRLSHHLSAAAYCTPSRAALLTARYPARYGLVAEEGTPTVIVHVASKVGLPLDEVTLATALSAANYTTAAVGKWHLGQRCGLLGQDCRGPQLHGFQSFYGLPLSLLNEMAGDHPFWIFPLSDPFYQVLVSLWLVSAVTLWLLKWRRSVVTVCLVLVTLVLAASWFIHTHYSFHNKIWWQVSPWMDKYMNGILMHDEKVVEQPLLLEGLSQRLVGHSVKFIADHSQDEQPFFLYHSFAHVHTPMFTASHMAGRSKHGRYGDNVEEMDQGVGDILAALEEHGLNENTIVYFLSDHGGHLEAVDENDQRVGGYNGHFKGGKGMGGAEGGIRVPGIYRWTGQLPAGVTMDTPTSLLDMMPTLLDLAGLPSLPDLLPHLSPRDLDGVSIAKLLTDGEPPASRSLLHHCGRDIHAVRVIHGNLAYKMNLVGYKWQPGSTQCGWGIGTFCSCFDIEDYDYEPELFNLKEDPYEDHPIPTNSSQYVQVTMLLKQFLAEWRVRVPYPPSQFKNVANTMHSIWLQPFSLF
nr:arylsulfatase H-like [Cherax quadricarinatus]